MGFQAVIDRPFDPVNDWGYLGPGYGVLGDSIGRTGAAATLVVVVLLVGTLLVVMPLSVGRVAGLAPRHRATSLRALAALAVVWVLCAVSGLQFARGAGRLDGGRQPGAARGQPGPGRDRGPGGLREGDRRRRLPRRPGRPAADRSARQGRAAGLRRELRPGRRPGLGLLTGGRRRARRRHRPLGGGRLLLAQRVPDLADVRRGQLAGPLHAAVGAVGRQPAALRPAAHQRPAHADQRVRRAGWRTVFDVPANTQDWPEGAAFYRFDQLYDSRTSATPARSSATRPCRTSTRWPPSGGWSWPRATGRR